MNLSSRRQLVEALIPVIRKAGDAALALQDDDVAVRAKEDGSPVTSADLASNDILRAACLALFPAMPVFSEEDSRVFEARKDSEPVLVIDPLDGTKEFIKGRDEFAVNIALVEDGHASAGLIYAPARDRLFFSYGAGLAFEQTAGGQRRGVIRSRLSAAPSRSPDAAGQAIIEAAGGVLQTDGTSLICDCKGKLKLNGFIAARTPPLAARLIATLRELETTSAVAAQQ
ncbi:3'(2'),5'-bisphosphate nucleotidase CysQ [Rhizobium leguminosarum bv. viciae 248]|nr:inositol monophosphatase family protein [Rhizobium leguminosarum]MCA2411854.1 3'(2'),5'-bisphosphate nucleotidase CysQ [Rhizobium leguminosarum]NKM63606.1 3'(2'),5'-bisphosphate nucleotidase CysQ [Rhizobium leguminosarum bv. viciae]QHW27611.1 3'(2'),5'-bisphosphate nucleotidase CysQ [Rhizobium leguminosarum bv. viciae 248]